MNDAPGGRLPVRPAPRLGELYTEAPLSQPKIWAGSRPVGVLRATASLREEPLPFGALTQLFHSVTVQPPGWDRIRALFARRSDARSSKGVR